MKPQTALVAATSAVLGTVFLVVLLVVGVADTTQPCASAGAVASSDGSPTILGPSTFTADQIIAWYSHSGRPDPASTIHTPLPTLVGDYLAFGQAEGVRGDVAFAQAVVETGGFANSDSIALNNFAGIAHCDSCGSGGGFPSVQAGVEAQMQDLRFYALGNNAPLAFPRIAPSISPAFAGQRTTWASLTGAWATDPGYWEAIDSVYTGMAGGGAVLASASAPAAAGGGCGNVFPVSSSSSASCGPVLAAALAGAPDDNARAAINAACTQIGKPYRWGAGHGDPTFDADPDPPAFDCSSFVAWAWARGGAQIDGTTYTQVALGTPIPDLAHAQPGDLVFLDGDSHVGMYLGNGLMIDAPHTGDVVKVESVWATPDAIRRVG